MPLRREETGLLDPVLREHGLGIYVEGLTERGIEFLADFPLAGEEMILDLKMKPIHANKLRHLKELHPPPEAPSPAYCSELKGVRKMAFDLIKPLIPADTLASLTAMEGGFEYQHLHKAGEQLLSAAASSSAAALNSMVDEQTKARLREYGLYKDNEHGVVWPFIRITIFLGKITLGPAFSVLDACRNAWAAVIDQVCWLWSGHVMLL